MLGRVIHLGVDAVLVSTVLAGIKRSTGLQYSLPWIMLTIDLNRRTSRTRKFEVQSTNTLTWETGSSTKVSRLCQARPTLSENVRNRILAMNGSPEGIFVTIFTCIGVHGVCIYSCPCGPWMVHFDGFVEFIFGALTRLISPFLTIPMIMIYV